MLTSLYHSNLLLKPFQCPWTHPLLVHSNSPLKYVFWNISGTSYLTIGVLYSDYQPLKRYLVLFGGNCQIRAYCGQALLCHCRCCSRSGCHQRLHRHEQRGAGCQEYLSPTKCVWKDKKENESKHTKYQYIKRQFEFSDVCGTHS